VSVDIYVIIPSRHPEKARRALDPEEAETTAVGRDYVALYYPDRFDEVKGDVERYGFELARSMPPSVRKGLDPRGIAAYPGVGQSFSDATYQSLLAHHGAPLWLPTERPSKKRRPATVKVLLIPISPKREALLMAHPDIVEGLVEKHLAEGMAGSLEIDDWIELQRTLFDAMMIEGSAADDLRADAVFPRRGLPLYEDKIVDAAKLISADRVAATADWLASLPESTVSAVRALTKRSPTALGFPDSLGPVPADDDAPPNGTRLQSKPRPRDAAMQALFARLVSFYGELGRQSQAVLCIRFRS
jgi:hypothetical protein